ncbi:UNVERIFIED_CONTAM: hypothetical protein FKN15_031290, partial [Acipenser sinensis]
FSEALRCTNTASSYYDTLLRKCISCAEVCGQHPVQCGAACQASTAAAAGAPSVLPPTSRALELQPARAVRPVLEHYHVALIYSLLGVCLSVLLFTLFMALLMMLRKRRGEACHRKEATQHTPATSKASLMESGSLQGSLSGRGTPKTVGTCSYCFPELAATETAPQTHRHTGLAAMETAPQTHRHTRLAATETAPQTHRHTGLAAMETAPQTHRHTGLAAMETAPQTHRHTGLAAMEAAPQTPRHTGLAAMETAPQTHRHTGLAAMETAPQTHRHTGLAAMETAPQTHRHPGLAAMETAPQTHRHTGLAAMETAPQTHRHTGLYQQAAATTASSMYCSDRTLNIICSPTQPTT